MNSLVKILALLARLRAAACPFPSSLSLLGGWTREAITDRNKAATAASAIDDPLESRFALLEKALANDPPAVRREILAAYREVHARSERAAAELRIQIPLALQ